MSPSLTECYEDRIAGVLSCYDRVVITGTVPVICYAEGMTRFLYANGIRIFDYPQFAQTLRDRVRDGAAVLPGTRPEAEPDNVGFMLSGCRTALDWPRVLHACHDTITIQITFFKFLHTHFIYFIERNHGFHVNFHMAMSFVNQLTCFRQ
jgi:hypothetical protein